MVGMDQIVEGKLNVTIHLSMELPVQNIQKVYYHKRADNPSIGR